MEFPRSWPPAIGSNEINQLQDLAIDWATSHGLLMRQAQSHSLVDVAHVPFALFPSPFPRSQFQHVDGRMQQLLNKLVHLIATDTEFLESIFEPYVYFALSFLKLLFHSLSKVDEFTGRLYDIWRTDGQHSISLGLNRMDYMLHQMDNGQCMAQMVEMNTMSVSFSSLSALVGDMHRFLTRRTDYFNERDPDALDVELNNLPVNESLSSLANGLWEAWRLYGNDKAVVLMVVQPAERNLYDQRWIEFKLFEKQVCFLNVNYLHTYHTQSWRPNGQKNFGTADE